MMNAGTDQEEENMNGEDKYGHSGEQVKVGSQKAQAQAQAQAQTQTQALQRRDVEVEKVVASAIVRMSAVVPKEMVHSALAREIIVVEAGHGHGHGHGHIYAQTLPRTMDATYTQPRPHSEPVPSEQRQRQKQLQHTSHHTPSARCPGHRASAESAPALLRGSSR